MVETITRRRSTSSNGRTITTEVTKVCEECGEDVCECQTMTRITRPASTVVTSEAGNRRMSNGTVTMMRSSRMNKSYGKLLSCGCREGSCMCKLTTPSVVRETVVSRSSTSPRRSTYLKSSKLNKSGYSRPVSTSSHRDTIVYDDSTGYLSVECNSLVADLDNVAAGKEELVYDTIEEMIESEGLSTVSHTKFKDGEAKIYVVEETDYGLDVALLQDSRNSCRRTYLAYAHGGHIHVASL